MQHGGRRNWIIKFIDDVPEAVAPEAVAPEAVAPIKGAGMCDADDCGGSRHVSFESRFTMKPSGAVDIDVCTDGDNTSKRVSIATSAWC